MLGERDAADRALCPCGNDRGTVIDGKCAGCWRDEALSLHTAPEPTPEAGCTCEPGKVQVLDCPVHSATPEEREGGETPDVRFTGPGGGQSCHVDVKAHGEWESAGAHMPCSFDRSDPTDALREAARIAEQRGGDVRLCPQDLRSLLDALRPTPEGEPVARYCPNCDVVAVPGTCCSGSEEREGGERVDWSTRIVGDGVRVTIGRQSFDVPVHRGADDTDEEHEDHLLWMQDQICHALYRLAEGRPTPEGEPVAEQVEKAVAILCEDRGYAGPPLIEIAASYIESGGVVDEVGEEVLTQQLRRLLAVYRANRRHPRTEGESVGVIDDAPSHAGGTPIDYSNRREVGGQAYWKAQQAGIALAKRWSREGLDPRLARRAASDLVDEGYAILPVDNVEVRDRHPRTDRPAVTSAERDAMQEDVAEMLRALGLGDHARPKSCHEVIQDEILPEIRRLRTDRPEEGLVEDAVTLSDLEDAVEAMRKHETTTHESYVVAVQLVGALRHLRDDGSGGDSDE